jgi:hypothetical protein
LWRSLLSLPFSWYSREFAAWRTVRREPQPGTFVLALRNAPHLGQSSNRKSRPGYLIGYNGCIVTEVEHRGAQLTFFTSISIPGNRMHPSRLRPALATFPHVAHTLITKAFEQAPIDAARRAELVDTTGDGKVDALGVDINGDGVVDTMIQLSTLQSKPARADSPTIHGGSSPQQGSRVARFFKDTSKKASNREPSKSMSDEQYEAASADSRRRAESAPQNSAAPPPRPPLRKLKREVSRKDLTSFQKQNKKKTARGRRSSVAEMEDDRDFFLRQAVGLFSGL